MEPRPKFTVCIDNKSYPASLGFGKIYRVLKDETAAQHQMMRVIDESGEDYLFPNRFFVEIDLQHSVEAALLSAAK